jgi:hypothetical protein
MLMDDPTYYDKHVTASVRYEMLFQCQRLLFEEEPGNTISCYCRGCFACRPAAPRLNHDIDQNLHKYKEIVWMVNTGPYCSRCQESHTNSLQINRHLKDVHEAINNVLCLASFNMNGQPGVQLKTIAQKETELWRLMAYKWEQTMGLAIKLAHKFICADVPREGQKAGFSFDEISDLPAFYSGLRLPLNSQQLKCEDDIFPTILALLWDPNIDCHMGGGEASPEQPCEELVPLKCMCLGCYSCRPHANRLNVDLGFEDQAAVISIKGHCKACKDCHQYRMMDGVTLLTLARNIRLILTAAGSEVTTGIVPIGQTLVDRRELILERFKYKWEQLLSIAFRLDA